MAFQALVGAVKAGKKVAEGKDKKKAGLLEGIRARRGGDSPEEKGKARKERMANVQSIWGESNTPITDKYTKDL